MKLKTKYPYKEPLDREQFAQFLTRIVDPTKDASPYKPDEKDDSFWRVDYTGNNWTLLFSDSGEIFQINYRYNFGHPEVEKALYGWLKVKISTLELVEE